MDYSKTLNLPKTDFPMKANLREREPAIQALWRELRVYEQSIAREAPGGGFLLHDGPPYSNGHIHVGNAMLNKLPKDFITRFKTMCGCRAPYIPGWDNHGMPIENNVVREFREKKLPVERLAVRKRCREYAANWVNIQMQEYVRLGIRGDWDRPYLTMDPHLEAAIIRVFGELAEKGFIYRGLRPIHWCPTCETALADAEIAYEDHESSSIYVFFPLLSDPAGVFEGHEGEPGVMIWTTTPWTIPANLAVAVHPDYDYVLARVDGKVAILAEGLLEQIRERTGADITVLAKIKGNALDGLVFRHPLFDRPSPVVFAGYVTLDEGTGIVHTAPGHGREDFETGRDNGLEVLCPVDEQGRFTAEAGPFAGMSIWDGNKAVEDALKDEGALFASGRISHSYPHCWRCHSPVIFRATVQWFMGLDHNGHREKTLEEIRKVQWLPEDGINRITAMVTGAPDWCVSRQRAWGVGIPVFFCKDCGADLLDRSAIEHVASVVEARNSDAWFELPAEELLSAGTKCAQCGSARFDKESDVLDVWFDSGSTCRGVLEGKQWPELSYPADVYLEGYDQYRGWFNKSLMIGVATKGAAPFRKVVANGFMVDAEGRAMHKTVGNVINTIDVINKYGADVMRLAAASFNVMSDARLGDEVLQRATDSYRRIRNTFRFLLANLSGYDPASEPPVTDMAELDRWILHRVQNVIAASRDAYESFEFHRIVHEVHNFCAIDLSALYLDVVKDRLYAEAPESPARRSAQAAMFRLLDGLVRLLAPILPHTCEEVWQAAGMNGTASSVHLAEFPEADEHLRDSAIDEKFQRLGAIREQVYRRIEEERQAGTIGKPGEAALTISAPEGDLDFLRDNLPVLPSYFIVSSVEVDPAADGALAVTVARAPGVKCERCWLIREDVGSSPDHPTLCARCAHVVAELPG